MTAVLPRATLIRVTSDDNDEIMYVAVRARDAVGFLDDAVTRLPGGCDAIAVPWETLPGVEAGARGSLALCESGVPYLTVGTVEDGQWITWYPKQPQPPVPL